MSPKQKRLNAIKQAEREAQKEAKAEADKVKANAEAEAAKIREKAQQEANRIREEAKKQAAAEKEKAQEEEARIKKEQEAERIQRRKDKLGQVFEFVDDDKNGFLDLKELTNHLDKDKSMDRAFWKQLFDFYDRNQDGRISLEEFIKFNMSDDLTEAEFYTKCEQMLHDGKEIHRSIAKQKADEETAAKKKAQDEAAALKNKAEEEAAAAKKKAEEEAAAAIKKAEEEAAAVIKKAQEEAAAATKKAEEEAAAARKAQEEAARAMMRQEKLGDIFDIFDLDGSNSLDIHELMSALDKDGSLDRGFWKQLFEYYDTNQDGKIDREEFVKFNLSDNLTDKEFDEKCDEMLTDAQRVAVAKAEAERFAEEEAAKAEAERVAKEEAEQAAAKAEADRLAEEEAEKKAAAEEAVAKSAEEAAERDRDSLQVQPAFTKQISPALTEEMEEAVNEEKDEGNEPVEPPLEKFVPGVICDFLHEYQWVSAKVLKRTPEHEVTVEFPGTYGDVTVSTADGSKFRDWSLKWTKGDDVDVCPEFVWLKGTVLEVGLSPGEYIVSYMDGDEQKEATVRFNKIRAASLQPTLQKGESEESLATIANIYSPPPPSANATSSAALGAVGKNQTLSEARLIPLPDEDKFEAGTLEAVKEVSQENISPPAKTTSEPLEQDEAEAEEKPAAKEETKAQNIFEEGFQKGEKVEMLEDFKWFEGTVIMRDEEKGYRVKRKESFGHTTVWVNEEDVRKPALKKKKSRGLPKRSSGGLPKPSILKNTAVGVSGADALDKADIDKSVLADADFDPLADAPDRPDPEAEKEEVKPSTVLFPELDTDAGLQTVEDGLDPLSGCASPPAKVPDVLKPDVKRKKSKGLPKKKSVKKQGTSQTYL